MTMASLRLNKLFNNIHLAEQFQSCRISSCRVLSATSYRNGLPFVEDKWTNRRETAPTLPSGKTHAFRKQNWQHIPKLWRAHEEIPCHYREGVNKAPFINPVKKKQIKKYKNRYEERDFYRTPTQRLMNSGKNLLPYDKSMPVITGKHTGPGVEGGTVLAQKLAALHIVQPTGYVDKKGKFKFVDNMVPEFVVPKLDGFKLKPYVSYRATEINQSKLTARSLFNSFYADQVRDRVENKGEEQKQKIEAPKPSRLSKLLPWKKSSE